MMVSRLDDPCGLLGVALASRRTKSENSEVPELIGIARMAAQSELLEAKSEVRYFEIAARL